MQNEMDDESAPKEYSEFPAWMFWKKRRYLVAFLAFFGFFNIYCLRVNLSIAIVAMTTINKIVLENGTTIETKEFDWDSKMQGYILSSFFYGYITTQLLGGLCAARIGGKTVFGVGVGVTALLTLVTPILARTSVWLLLAARIIEGVFEGVTVPCMHAVWARWAPPFERSRLATIAYSGGNMGTVVSMPVCAKLAEILGWESVFYVFGVLGLIWVVLWWFIVSDSPQSDPYISENELKYLEATLPRTTDQKGHIKHPWKNIFLSAPVWAIICSNFSENWGFYTLLTQLPKFLRQALNFDLSKTGFLSGLPYLAMCIFVVFSGYLADLLQYKSILTTTQVRRTFNCGAFLAQTIFMMTAAYWMDPIGVVFCLTMAVAFGAFAWSGFAVNHLDIAPQHASVLMGISNTFGTIPGILSPILSGYLVTNGTIDEWRTVFYVSSAIYLIGCVIYGSFASGELQPWANEAKLSNDPKSIEKNAYYNKTFQREQNVY